MARGGYIGNGGVSGERGGGVIGNLAKLGKRGNRDVLRHLAREGSDGWCWWKGTVIPGDKEVRGVMGYCGTYRKGVRGVIGKGGVVEPG